MYWRCISVARLCHRHLLGNIRHTHPYLHCRIPCYRTAAHHLHLGVHGRCSLRRPRVSYLRHHHYGVGWCRVQARSPRVVTVTLCHNCRRRVISDIRYRRLHAAARHRSQCCHFLDLRHCNAFLSIVGAEKNQLQAINLPYLSAAT